MNNQDDVTMKKTKVSVLCYAYLVLVMGVLNNSTIHGYLNGIKTYNYGMLSKQNM